MYSIKNIDGKECNRAKGVSIATEFNEFKDTLFNKKMLRYKMARIQSKLHKIGTYEIDKKSLSVFDDRRSVSDDSIHTLAYFHKNFKKIDSQDSRKQRFKKVLTKTKDLKR